jgi:flagellar hook-length control protein FliK
MATRPRGAVVIHLNPEDLGSITLTVKAVGNSIETQIHASDGAVRNALDQNHAQLAASLEQKGFTLSQMTVTGSSGSSLGTDAQARQQQAQQQNHNQAAQRQSANHQYGSKLPDDQAQARQFVRKATGVDLWI